MPAFSPAFDQRHIRTLLVKLDLDVRNASQEDRRPHRHDLKRAPGMSGEILERFHALA